MLFLLLFRVRTKRLFSRSDGKFVSIYRSFSRRCKFWCKKLIYNWLQVCFDMLTEAADQSQFSKIASSSFIEFVWPFSFSMLFMCGVIMSFIGVFMRLCVFHSIFHLVLFSLTMRAQKKNLQQRQQRLKYTYLPKLNTHDIHKNTNRHHQQQQQHGKMVRMKETAKKKQRKKWKKKERKKKK